MKGRKMSKEAKAPSPFLLALEPLRAGLGYLALHASSKAFAKGNGQPVIVYPGLATNELATSVFRKNLNRSGFESYDWKQGLNRGPKGDFEQWLARLAEQVHELEAAHCQPVALIGWSLGGVFAREVAKRTASKVSQVITLGTPFAANADATNAGKVYELLNGGAPVLSPALMASLRRCPPVPTTSIYSRTDGVVAWEGCVERETRSSQSIELNHVSHFGMVLSPRVLEVVTDRLAQPHGEWERYGQDKRELSRKAKKAATQAA